MQNVRALSLAVMVLLGGCETEAARQGKLEQEAKDALDGASRDPLSMQVRKVFAKSDRLLCGEVNIKLESGQYQGFRVFSVDRAKHKAIVAEPTPIQSIDGEKPIEVCTTPAQRATFEKEKAASKNAYDRDLAEYERQTKLEQAEADLRLKRALTQ